MYKRKERLGEFVVARCNAPELLDATEESLDQISLLVDMTIERTGIESIGTRRNHCLTTLSRNRCDEGIRVVSFVGDDETRRLILDQRVGLIDIGNLASRENHAQRIAQRIDGNMQFGRQSAPRATDTLPPFFFWAPAECWWARTMVESRNRCSMSASPRIAVATRCQRRFKTDTEFQ